MLLKGTSGVALKVFVVITFLDLRGTRRCNGDVVVARALEHEPVRSQGYLHVGRLPSANRLRPAFVIE
jgi:hypothetical protein